MRNSQALSVSLALYPNRFPLALKINSLFCSISLPVLFFSMNHVTLSFYAPLCLCVLRPCTMHVLLYCTIVPFFTACRSKDSDCNWYNTLFLLGSRYYVYFLGIYF
ncbi:hypothetical protein L6164_012187 [Bauhinia variegata]|uniref:Uncharacterized protein n=1 Tax=Bauhinia variegata TaxID=167791 RepID=A0ACB9PAH3_BAUVA|nr:hypothetical protein L6164_012187 [Bauhinia variegata]